MKKIALSFFALSVLLSAHDRIAPTFTSPATVTVKENQETAIKLIATDPATRLKRWERRYKWYFGPRHEANTSRYTIASLDANFFNINSQTGEVTFKKNPDFEIKSSYEFIATATDAHKNRSNQHVEIQIIDVPEGIVDTTSPVISSDTTFVVKENQLKAFTAIATDETSEVVYSIFFDDYTDFFINANSGEVSFQKAPDYETKQNYTFTLYATDSSNNRASQEITILIEDVDDNVITPLPTTDGDTITHNGLTYKTILGPNGYTWLDRNIGATQACTSSMDEKCFGDYYQLGRGNDGHEKLTSPRTTTRITTLDNPGNKFVVHTYDWIKLSNADQLRQDTWQAKDGSSICPTGFYVPTVLDISRSRPTSGTLSEAINLPSAGIVWNADGLLRNENRSTYIWTSDVNTDTRAYQDGGLSAYNPSHGIPVRCIKAK